MKISIVGSGHVGLVSGACFAEKGHDVLCVDGDPAKIDTLKSGRMPFFEPEKRRRPARASDPASVASNSKVQLVPVIRQALPPAPSARPAPTLITRSLRSATS